MALRPAYCTAKADDEPCLASDVVVRLIGGNLARLERQAIERRLDECEVCRRFVAEVMRQEQESAATRNAAGGSGALPEATVAGAPARARAPVTRADVARPDVTRTEPGDDAGAAADDRRGPEPLRLPVPGQRIDRYVIVRPLGVGGMGMVSLARDEELKRHVVIKLVRPDLITAERPDRGETLAARLIREAQALARLSHPCVVSIFDIGRYSGQVFFAMEFVEGVDLATYLATGPRPTADILAKFRQAGVGLAAAHRAGVVHRDFKPANVLVGDNGVVKVADFGLARGVASAQSSAEMSTLPGRAPAPAKRSSLLDAALTHIDATVGTPAYMAPEQIAGEGVDARSDQFAFAVSLIDSLLGQLPPTRSVQPQKASAGELASLDRQLADVGLGPAPRAALLRAISEEPSARFGSLDELLAQLDDATPMSAPMPGRAATPLPQQRTAEPVLTAEPTAPPSLSRTGSGRGRKGLLLAALGTLGGGALIWWAVARGASPVDPGCMAEHDALARALPDERRRQLVASLPLTTPFELWAAESAVAVLDERLAALGAAHRDRCVAGAGAAATNTANPNTTDCQLTRHQQLQPLLTSLVTVDDLDAASSSIELCDGRQSPRPFEAAARPRLEALSRALRQGDLKRAGIDAQELAAELSQRAPSMAARAWRISALAALLSGGAEAEDRIARCTADAERSGDDSSRAQALLLQMELALTRQDGARVEQLAEILRSLVARRGSRPIDLAEVESVIAAAHDRLGRTRTSVLEWGHARRRAALAAGAPEHAALAEALRARAAAGELAARSRNLKANLTDRRDLLALVQPPPRPTEGRMRAWLEAVAATLALDLEVPSQILLEAAAAISPGTDATAGMVRIRAAAARAEGKELNAWFDAALQAAGEKHRAREVAELAIERARIAVASALATAAPIDGASTGEPSSEPSREAPGPLKPAPPRATSPGLEAAVTAIRRAERIFFSPAWTSDGYNKFTELSLRVSLLEAELVDAGLVSASQVVLVRSQYQTLPVDSLLRAEAAWRYAQLGRQTSRYLQGGEDLEQALEVWKFTGEHERAATAAWWLAQSTMTRRDDAKKYAELAKELFRQLDDPKRLEEIEAWQRARGDEIR